MLTKEERISVLEKQKVLSGRVFDFDAKERPGMRELVDVVSL